MHHLVEKRQQQRQPLVMMPSHLKLVFLLFEELMQKLDQHHQ
jgi:hypothetical protein